MHLNRSYGPVALLFLAGFGALLTAGAAEEDAPARPTTRPAARQAGNERALHNGMEEMGRAFKKLQAQISDGTMNESSLALVVQMQTLTLACKNEVPPLVKRMPATQQADAKSDYRMMMLSLLRMETDLEEQLLTSDNKKAADTVAEMDKLQKDGHKDFRPKRQSRGG